MCNFITILHLFVILIKMSHIIIFLTPSPPPFLNFIYIYTLKFNRLYNNTFLLDQIPKSIHNSPKSFCVNLFKWLTIENIEHHTRFSEFAIPTKVKCQKIWPGMRKAMNEIKEWLKTLSEILVRLKFMWLFKQNSNNEINANFVRKND